MERSERDRAGWTRAWPAVALAAAVLAAVAWRIWAGGEHQHALIGPNNDGSPGMEGRGALPDEPQAASQQAPIQRERAASRSNPGTSEATTRDPRRTAEIRRALQALAEAGPGALWSAPRAAAPIAIAGPEGMPLPEPGQRNQADAGLGHYIADRVHEDFAPLADKCYEDALAKNPGLRGKATLRFTIVGDPRIGAVVESSRVGDDSEIQDPMFRECLQESMMTVNFAPPPEGTKEISSTFSLRFAPSADGG
ncbi:MAG: AgmX/PglI C-terminal domain-containing protein [Myxococcales bacterium]|nr:AgmX/PglI C-terminal domain-containing protein [Myxococcales bacterium]